MLLYLGLKPMSAPYSGTVIPEACAPQMAPYNTQYERLSAHMEAAGVTAEPNLWDRPVSLAREHRRPPAGPDGQPPLPGSGSPTGSSDSPTGGAAPPPAVSLLPPDKLLPFMIPFQGGRGHMCGGAASDAQPRCAPVTGLVFKDKG